MFKESDEEAVAEVQLWGSGSSDLYQACGHKKKRNVWFEMYFEDEIDGSWQWKNCSEKKIHKNDIQVLNWSVWLGKRTI